MLLKGYQQRTLDALRDYFRACLQYNSAAAAFTMVTEQVFGQGLVYNPVKELPGLPYVCLRIPTGGGKTIVAAHAVGVAAGELLHSERPVVLWLTPSNTIKDQTLNAFKDLRHPYTQALRERFGNLTVLDVSEALGIQPATIQSGATVIVSTMQAFRVEETEGRKVYEQSSALVGHFENLSTTLAAGLEKYPGSDKPIPSLANMLRKHRPVVIVDEAHNVRTGLSFETLRRFQPSCIIEFSATPDRVKNPSNILYSVSAAELKTDDMIKLPIRLETHMDWRTVVSDAVATRHGLEAVAQQEQDLTGEYIRPILLLQAQPRYKDKDSLTVEVLEKCLLEDHHIPAEQIRRATGEDNQIEGEDLLSPTSKVRYIITVQALREGWDCPFAYVLCSVAEAHSATAVEQILGRVLRMPRAKRKVREELNLAYAFAASTNFVSTVNALSEALVQHGFEKQEVKDLIIPGLKAPPQRDLDFGQLFGQPEGPEPGTVQVTVEEAPALEKLPESVASKIEYDVQRQQIAIKEPLKAEEYQALKECFTTLAAQQAIEAARVNAQPTDEKKPARPMVSVAWLCIKQGNLLEPLEGSHIREAGWKLTGKDAGLSEAEFLSDPAEGQQVELDISAEGKVKQKFIAELQLELQLLDADRDWSAADLVCWLDENIEHEDLEKDQTVPFLTRMVQGLMRDRGLSLDYLVKEKYRLMQSAAAKIEQYRQEALRRSFNKMLLDDGGPLVVTPEKLFTYDPDPMHYPYPATGSLFPYQHSFRKHYYPTVGELRAGSEEYQCAQLLDMMKEVAVWIRNLDRRPGYAFWLQTSTDRFYPDFVCKLVDGRYMVVEYKGSHLWGAPDAEEKRMIGAVWEKRSQGKYLFLMPNGPDWNAIRAKVK